MSRAKRQVECVAFMLIKEGQVLAEKRKQTKKADPGATALPGGHIENGESPKDALLRETYEELGIVPGSMRFICTLFHETEEFQRIHYFAVEAWHGAIESHEAEYLLWIPVTEPHRLDIDPDRVALRLAARL